MQTCFLIFSKSTFFHLRPSLIKQTILHVTNRPISLFSIARQHAMHVSAMTYNVLIATLNPTHSLTHSLARSLCRARYCVSKTVRLSFCLSVRPLHSGIVSKRRTNAHIVKFSTVWLEHDPSFSERYRRYEISRELPQRGWG